MRRNCPTLAERFGRPGRAAPTIRLIFSHILTPWATILGAAARLLAAFYCLAVCLSVLQAKTIPKLPRLELRDFAPPIRQQLQEAYDRARARPNDAAASGHLGMLLQAYSQFEAAAVCFQRAGSLQPEEWKWIYYHGVVQALLGRHEEAAAALAAVVRRKQDYLPARLKLAESLFSSGKLMESERIYETVTKEHPDSAVAHYGLGRAKAARRELETAVEHLRKASDLFPSFGAAHYALGLAYRDLGDTGKAGKQFALYEKNKLAWPPADDPLLDAVDDLNAGAPYHLKRGIALESAGQMQAAIAEHERALEIDPKYVQAHVNLITLYGKLGQAENAEKHYRAAIAINPDLAEAHYNFGVLLNEQGKEEEAAGAFSKALEVNPFYAEAHNNLAYFLMTRGKLEEAERHYRAAIENKPNYRIARFNLGRILVNEGKLAEAIEHFRLTLEPEDNDTPSFMYALGAAYARAGNRDSALHYLREAKARATALGQRGLVNSIDRDLRILDGTAPR